MYVLCNGRHPAWKPVDMEKIPWFSLGFSTIGGRWLALGFLNHQQYHISPPKIPAIETFQRLRFPAIPGEVMWNQRETNALNFSQGGGHGRGLLRESVSWQSEWDLGPTLGGESLWYYKTIQIKVSLKSNLKLYIECLQPVFLISFCHHYLEIFEAVDSFNPTCPPFFFGHLQLSLQSIPTLTGSLGLCSWSCSGNWSSYVWAERHHCCGLWLLKHVHI